MKYLDEYRDSHLVQGIVQRIHRHSRRKVRFMEFCGSHTTSIMKNGLRQLLPPNIRMVSGPGCPVCVTDNADLDKAIALAGVPGVVLLTFGDMMKVPGSRSSLEKARAEGADVRIVYSALNALQIARDTPWRPVVLVGIGFETTAPTIAASLLQAQHEGIENYFVLSLHKVCPPAIQSLLELEGVQLQGLICPGHVSAITGSLAWDFVADRYHVPCVVAGFEPMDILQSINMLVEQVERGESKVEIAYRRGVRREGNPKALELMDMVFEPSEARWRGLGVVPGSGLALREAFARFDAGLVFDIDAGPTMSPAGCICGAILMGVKAPPECRLFGKACTPAAPVGPCMVSSEGSCSAYYLYGEACV